MGKIARRIVYWIRSRHHDAALREELDFHQTMKELELERDGLTRDEARFAARRQVGNATRAREDSRAVWIVPWLESLGVDRDDTFCLSIIREAEDRLLKSGKMPPGYSD